MKHLILTLFMLPFLVKGQTISQKADELLTAYSNQHKFSGNVLIAKEGKIIFQKSYGYADIKTKTPNTANTEFRVGSLTKMFTSTAILKLAEEGKLSLTDPVNKYVSNFAYGDSVKIINLLSHTSGIKGYTSSPEPVTLKESVDRFIYQPLAFTPGTQFEYNNFNYILLSSIAEKASGVAFPELIRSDVLAKAGMNQSGLDYRSRNSAAKAHGYTTNPATAEWTEANEGNVAIASGAGALYSTSQDLYKWSEAISKRSVLQDSLLQLAMKPIQNNYGMGWMTTDAFGRKQIGHTGSIPGFIANFMKFPDQDVTIILLSNYEDVDGRQISKDLAAVTFGEAYNLPVVKKEVKLSDDVLNRYVGEYKLPNGFSIAVSNEGNKLFALAQGDQEKVELTPESETKFFLKGPDTAIEFIQEDGVVKYMFVDLQGGQKLTKVTDPK
jgi:CubicO group peptidase (beta-lactamase class C family)